MNKPLAGKQGSSPPAAERAPKAPPAEPKQAVIELPTSVTVRDLADILHVSGVVIIKQLMRSGVMANINQVVDYETARGVAAGLGLEVRPKSVPKETAPSALDIKKRQREMKAATSVLIRPPVVTIMGHVDHGKTRLLDAIRQTNVMGSEAGGITQHIGAYQVEVNGQKITFLDTPGHEAFTAMRARGAQVTDIAVLVVAADDGVMPQTLEAISHAKAAGVPIIVAINKIDKPGANADLVKQQLADAGLVIEEWGGEVIAVPVSAKEKKGIKELLDNVLVVAELEELKGDSSLPPEGVVIEAGMDKSRGPVATVLVQNGTLKIGDMIVIGTAWGRVRAMFNDKGKPMRKAEPSTPTEILGLESVPQVGDMITLVANEHDAKALVEQRPAASGATAPGAQVSLSNIYDQISAGKMKVLNIILKADVQGSIEPIRNSLEGASTDEVRVKVLHAATGNVNESDVMLAIASKGIIIGFNVATEPGAKRVADQEGIAIRNYDVIYHMVDDVVKALKGMLEPTIVEVVEGRGEIRATFPAGKKDIVAGIMATEGRATRGSLVRVLRKGEKLTESTIVSMRRFKDDIKECTAGMECGIILKDYKEFETGDILEFYRKEERR